MMNLQIIECKEGSYQVVFAPGRNVRKIASELRHEGGEKLIGFVNLEKINDPAIRAFAALGSLAVEANRARGDVPLETLLLNIFMAGVNAGKKGKNERRILK